MKRMREVHAAEVVSLQEEHSKTMREKDNEMLELSVGQSECTAS
jgi:hypothetical protein